MYVSLFQARTNVVRTMESLLHHPHQHIRKFTKLRASEIPITGSNGEQACIAIRREDGHSPWERRAPLGPEHVGALVKRGVKVLLQPSNRRAYPMTAYQANGAIVEEDLTEATLILGVKQVPIDSLIPNKTYTFFSHTIKAQEANMNLLDALLEKNIRLIDYEKMVEENGQRVVAFGKYAGVAGMINILNGLGLRLLAMGHHTPFMFIGPAQNYRNSAMAKQALRDAGFEISIGMMPNSIGPIIVVFTGSGNVSQGAQEIFQELPHEFVEPAHLHRVATHGLTNKVYGCVISREDHFRRRNGGGFDAAEYEQHPERYISIFSQKYASYATVIVNGIYWAHNSPRLLTIPDAKRLLKRLDTPWLPSSPGCPQLPHRLLALCDISADPGGSIEFMKECTTIDKPFCLYDADENMETESFAGDGVLICSIDNMPAQIPREATDYFGSILLPYVPDMIQSDATTPFEEMKAGPVVRNAVITTNGKLTSDYQYIATLRANKRHAKGQAPGSGSTKKKVIILGAGHVAPPVLDYLTKEGNYDITLASALQSSVDSLASNYEGVTPVLLDVAFKPQELEEHVKKADLVISLLPYTCHADIMKACIRQKVNMVTASYIQPEMRELEHGAVEAGITVLNEMGVDPGIDHFLAKECIDDIHSRDGVIKSYSSFCGGIPAPECSENPLRYKFSWSPKGVLLNVLSDARYLMKGEEVYIPGNGSLLDSTKDIAFLPGFHLEGFANRNSLNYKSLYGIESAHTIIRGTLRFKGFSQACKAIHALRLLDIAPHPVLHPKGPSLTWKQLLCELIAIPRDTFIDSLRDEVHKRLDMNDSMMDAIEGLGLISDQEVDKRLTPIDTLSNYLAKRLAYGPGERDMIVMRNDLEAEYMGGNRELRKISFIVYGDKKGYSAMAKTVGYTTAIGAKMILDGEIQTKGLLLPFSRDIYRPVLKRLKTNFDIEATEHIEML